MRMSVYFDGLEPNDVPSAPLFFHSNAPPWAYSLAAGDGRVPDAAYHVTPSKVALKLGCRMSEEDHAVRIRSVDAYEVDIETEVLGDGDTVIAADESAEMFPMVERVSGGYWLDPSSLNVGPSGSRALKAPTGVPMDFSKMDDWMAQYLDGDYELDEEKKVETFTADDSSSAGTRRFGDSHRRMFEKSRDYVEKLRYLKHSEDAPKKILEKYHLADDVADEERWARLAGIDPTGKKYSEFYDDLFGDDDPKAEEVMDLMRDLAIEPARAMAIGLARTSNVYETRHARLGGGDDPRKTGCVLYPLHPQMMSPKLFRLLARMALATRFAGSMQYASPDDTAAAAHARAYGVFARFYAQADFEPGSVKINGTPEYFIGGSVTAWKMEASMLFAIASRDFPHGILAFLCGHTSRMLTSHAAGANALPRYWKRGSAYLLSQGENQSAIVRTRSPFLVTYQSARPACWVLFNAHILSASLELPGFFAVRLDTTYQGTVKYVIADDLLATIKQNPVLGTVLRNFGFHHIFNDWDAAFKELMEQAPFSQTYSGYLYGRRLHADARLRGRLDEARPIAVGIMQAMPSDNYRMSISLTSWVQDLSPHQLIAAMITDAAMRGMRGQIARYTARTTRAIMGARGGDEE
jgi:hypothetical protein